MKESGRVQLLIRIHKFGLAAIVLLASGCGDFFSKRPTEIQSMSILEELGQVRESPYINNPVPSMYQQRATRLPIKDGVKLFYFTQNHPANHLATLIEQQLGVKSTTSNAVNQIVAYCKDDEQADAVQQYLHLIDIEPVQVNIDCLILERFGDITMDWETSILVENLLGEEITIGEARGTFDNEGVLVDLDPAFPGASLREVERQRFGLDFGYWMNKGVPGHQVRAIVDVLISRGYLKILLNPQLETVNGQAATVTIRDYTPIEEVRTSSAGVGSVYNITKYVWVEDTLTVLPHVYSDGSIGLKTDIKIGSRSKPEGVVQRSIITERSINVEENRVQPGLSLIIGGMRKSEKRSVVRGVPFFKDLPIIGVLFSSKDFEEKGTEIVFILTPSISSGSVPNAKIVSDLRRKYADPEYESGLSSALTEPLSTGVYMDVLEREATDAELRRVEAEILLEQVKQTAQSQKDRADLADAEAEKLRLKASELQKKAERLNAENIALSEQVENTKAQDQADSQIQEQKEKLPNMQGIKEQQLENEETKSQTDANQIPAAQ